MLRTTNGPSRIVCLTEEPTEILYLLGEQDRVVGISAYTVRPAEAKRDKPIVSAFVGGSVERICALRPDLVVGFSDIQADLARSLIARNLPVLIFNQRSVQEILDVVLTLGRIVDAGARAEALVAGYVRRIEGLREKTAAYVERPKIYFEEWDDPTITAIAWVSELIEIAGGTNVFADRALGRLASERFVEAKEVVERDPDIVLGCWCGKAFDRGAFESRPGFRQLSAVRRGWVREVPPEIILQPGPAALTAGLDYLAGTVDEWLNCPR